MIVCMKTKKKRLTKKDGRGGGERQRETRRKRKERDVQIGLE